VAETPNALKVVAAILCWDPGDRPVATCRGSRGNAQPSLSCWRFIAVRSAGFGIHLV
jgi:hypothetical protein